MLKHHGNHGLSDEFRLTPPGGGMGSKFSRLADPQGCASCGNRHPCIALLSIVGIYPVGTQRLRELRWRVSCVSIVSMGEMAVSHIQSPVPNGNQQRIVHLSYPCRQLGAMSVLGACMDTNDGKYTTIRFD